MSNDEPNRVYLGRHSNVLERNEVFLRPEGFEVDLRSLISLRRRWILFDEVSLVTLHPARSWPGAVLAGVLAMGFGILGGLFVVIDEETAAPGWFLLALALVLAGLGAVSLMVPRWTVTIHGLRARAAMSSPSQTTMRDIYGETVRRVAESRVSRPGPGGTPAVPWPPLEPPQPPVIAYEPG